MGFEPVNKACFVTTRAIQQIKTQLETSQSFSDIAGGHVVDDEVWHFSMIY